jgi:hypothetical protein
MENQKGYTTLIIMFTAALVLLAIGFLVIRNNSSEPAADNGQQDSSQSDNQQNQQPEQQIDVAAYTAGWQTYTNAKYGYEVKYPPNVKAGSVSANSVLGTFSAPVKGFDVGPLVFVSLTGELRQEGADYFNSSYNLALNPPDPIPGGPVVACMVEAIDNPNVEVKSVSCEGEGGPARYALIIGEEYDVFVDGYSKGFDNSDNGEFENSQDYLALLATFKFVSTTSTQPTPQTQADSETSIDAPPPADPEPDDPPVLQSFSITADDFSATPSSITVPVGTIVNLTFNISAENVYYGGLEFRSSVVNTGSISPGGSKTVAFTVSESFDFVPYWPASQVRKDYVVKIIAE